MKSKFTILASLIVVITLLAGCAHIQEQQPAPAQNEAPSAASVAATPTSAVLPTHTLAATNIVAPTATPDMNDPWYGVDPSGQQIVFWHIYDGEREQGLAAIVNDFNSSNPYGIQVAAANQGSYVDIFNKMLEAVGTPDAPDILIAFQNQAAIYQLNGGLADLNSLVASSIWGFSDEEMNSFFPGVRSQDIYPSLGGQRLGAPFYRSVDVVYYNADWLEALGYNDPPATPDDFAEVACAAANSPYQPELAGESTGTLFFSDASRLASWVFALGGDIYDTASGQFSLNGDLVKGALSYQRDLIARGCAQQSLDWDFDAEQFIQGKVLMIQASSNLVSYFSELEEAGSLSFDWGVTAYPHLTPEPVSNAYGPSLSISKSAPERELAAFLFLKHLLSPESQARWAQASGSLPVRADLSDALDGWFGEYPAYQSAYRLMPNTKYEPALPGYDFVRVEIETSVSAVLEGGDVNAIMDALNTKAGEIIASQRQP